MHLFIHDFVGFSLSLVIVRFSIWINNVAVLVKCSPLFSFGYYQFDSLFNSQQINKIITPVCTTCTHK